MTHALTCPNTPTDADELAATVAAAQAGDPRAVEAVLARLEGAVIALAHQRAERTANGMAHRDDMAQEGRMAILGALKDYSPQPGAAFTTYAMTRIKNAISQAAWQETTPGVDQRDARTYLAALRETDGDHDAAEALVRTLPDTKHRLSRESARAARLAFAPPVALDTMTHDDAEAAQREFKFRGDRVKSPQDRWAERQGKADASLGLVRDDVAHDQHIRAALVNRVLLPKLSPTQRQVIDHTYGTSGAAWLVKVSAIGMRGADVTPDLEAIAGEIGTTTAAVKQHKSAGLAKLRRSYGDFEDALATAESIAA
ncbi:sigma-70 family RNA polymerase sigma factor [Kitasatospora sp. MBT66]|uniref:sigma-70 family RNA polymerase sigma factor n=1 Tax=Kitasatospora sp. MBT66 TaxID=1444769 RepID=UPI0006906AA1|nr:sigma-70 family RNA polymerase sigma factor [Kitasatospora sp. MBT66]